jgi:hypothetical protein
MKAIWRQQGKDWEIAHGKSYRDEAHLQAFLAENPTLIPFEDVSKEILPPHVMIREVGLPGSGSTDIVGIDESGGITIIECKLATNPEVKRKVIGQVFEYAAFLWRKPYSFLDSIARSRLGKNLTEAMRDTLDDEVLEEWSDIDFVQSVTQTLSTGDFRILVAVDAVNEELRRTIEYLTEGPSSMEVFALEVTYFASEDREILVPHLHGSISSRPPIVPRRTSKQWTRERFFKDAEARGLDMEVIQAMHDLLAFSEVEASKIYWGTGKETGSFTFHHLQDDVTYSLFSVRSDGRIQINFGWLTEKLSVETIAQYWDGLKGIGRLRELTVKENYYCWPSIKLVNAFPNKEDLYQFQEAVTTFRDKILEDT